MMKRKTILKSYVARYLNHQELREFHSPSDKVCGKYPKASFFRYSPKLFLRMDMEWESSENKCHPCLYADFGSDASVHLQYKKLRVTHELNADTLKELVSFVFSQEGKEQCTKVTFGFYTFYVWNHMLFIEGIKEIRSLFFCTEGKAGLKGIRIFLNNIKSLPQAVSALKDIILKELIPIFATLNGDIAVSSVDDIYKLIKPGSIGDRERTLSLVDRLNIAKYIEHEKMG